MAACVSAYCGKAARGAKQACSFLKKRTKKLLLLGLRAAGTSRPNEQKSFASFL
jgi:hypothetical protein